MQQVMRISPQTNVEFVELDLADQCSIRRAAAEIRSKVDRLDVLINNAAIMALPMMQKTKDGIEAQFGTNHLGHFLLTNLVMDRIMMAGKGARIVNVTSTAFELSEIRWDDWNFQVGACFAVTTMNLAHSCIIVRTVKLMTLGKHMANQRLRMSSSLLA